MARCRRSCVLIKLSATPHPVTLINFRDHRGALYISIHGFWYSTKKAQQKQSDVNFKAFANRFGVSK